MPTIVLVTFYSRTGETERLATAAAVGAVQARANIRMRRLVDADRDATLARHPESADGLRRMWKEYVPPKEADVRAADGLVIGLPAAMSPSSPECAPFFALLERLHADGALSRKTAAVVGAGATSAATVDTLRRIGLTLVEPNPTTGSDAREDAIDLGRRLVSAVASIKGSAAAGHSS